MASLDMLEGHVQARQGKSNVEKESVFTQSAKNVSVACQANLDDSENEQESGSEEYSEVSSEGEEGSSGGSSKSYESDDFAKRHKFSMTDQQLKENLLLLHQGKGNLYHTRTSSWSRQKKMACAAYKLFKIKRWHLTDVNLVFDPLIRDASSSYVKKEDLLWPENSVYPNLESVEISVKTISVDGILATANQGKQKMENLEKLDEVLKDIDGPLNLPRGPRRGRPMDYVLDRLVIRAMRVLPKAIRNPFYKFIFALLNAMHKSEKKEKIPEVTFENLFKTLVSCVTACMNEEASIGCDGTMDGITLDQLQLDVYMGNDIKTLTVSSIPDLFIFERTRKTTSKRAIAVVEVKGKHGECVVHSDDEEESSKEPTELGIIEEEESEEELPRIEKIVKAKHDRMKKISRENRRRLTKFLPQLIGEMLCCNGNSVLVNIKADDPGYSFGIAVVGFDVYFVTLVASTSQGIHETFRKPRVYYNVFITRPFNICSKGDRRIVLKVLAAGFYVEETVPFPSSDDSDDISSLDLAGLNIM